MKPADIAAELSKHTDRLADAGKDASVEPLLQAAKQVAGNIRVVAARAGHSVDIRVIERRNGVRITVTGPQAHRYRHMATEQLDRLRPQTAEEVKAGITRKIR